MDKCLECDSSDVLYSYFYCQHPVMLEESSRGRLIGYLVALETCPIWCPKRFSNPNAAKKFDPVKVEK